jgi:hypothetical protein
VVPCGKMHLVFPAFRRLSRACLGESIVLISKMAQIAAFFAPAFTSRSVTSLPPSDAAAKTSTVCTTIVLVLASRFPYACLEPILVKRSFLDENRGYFVPRFLTWCGKPRRASPPRHVTRLACGWKELNVIDEAQPVRNTASFLSAFPMSFPSLPW